jgi:hypothetical protein
VRNSFHEPAGDIDIAMLDSLKVLEMAIREADLGEARYPRLADLDVAPFTDQQADPSI